MRWATRWLLVVIIPVTLMENTQLNMAMMYQEAKNPAVEEAPCMLISSGLSRWTFN